MTGKCENTDCLWCGKQIEGRRRKYCNRKCYDAYDNHRKRQATKAAMLALNLKCEHCGKLIISGNKRRFCSVQCKDWFGRAKRYKRTPIGQAIKTTCKSCRMEFVIPANRKGGDASSQYCSKRCKRRWSNAKEKLADRFSTTWANITDDEARVYLAMSAINIKAGQMTREQTKRQRTNKSIEQRVFTRHTERKRQGVTPQTK